MFKDPDFKLTDNKSGKTNNYCRPGKGGYIGYLSLFLGIFLFLPISAKPEKLDSKYSIHILGANVGNFSVTQVRKNDNINIDAVTDIKINLLFSYRVKYVQHTIYKKGILQSSHVKTYKNEKLNSDVWIKRENESYLLVANGDSSVINKSITYSGSLIYFNEPVEIEKIFKERTTEVQLINQVGEHTYIIEDEKGRELNRYDYEGGVLQSAKMKHTLGKIELKHEATTIIDD